MSEELEEKKITIVVSKNEITVDWDKDKMSDLEAYGAISVVHADMLGMIGRGSESIESVIGNIASHDTPNMSEASVPEEK